MTEFPPFMFREYCLECGHVLVGNTECHNPNCDKKEIEE